MISQSKTVTQFISKISSVWRILATKLPTLSLALFLGVLFYSTFSLIRGTTPTLYMLTFSLSLFSCGGIFYYLYNNKIVDRDVLSVNRDLSINRDFFNIKILLIIFVVSITFVFMILHNVYYVKPYEYYLLIGVAAVSVALQIVLKKEINSEEVLIILFQIIVLATIIRASSLFLSPFNVGVDTHNFHFPTILEIIRTGHLNPKSFYYFYYPCSHLIQAVTGLLFEFSISSFKLVNLCSSLILIPITYLIGSYLSDKKNGLMCALLFSLSTMSLFIVTFNTSKIGGTTLFLLIIYILLKILSSSLEVKYVLLFIICSLSLFLWHPEISSSLFFVLLAYFLCKVIICYRLRLDSLLLLYFVFYISYDMYVSTPLFQSIIRGIFFVDASSSSDALIQNFIGRSIDISLMSQLFTSYLGICIPLFFVTYAFFSWMKTINLKNQFLMFCFICICLTPAICVFSNNKSLSPTRFLTYISLISLIITSLSIFDVFNLKTKRSIFFFTCLIFIFSIFSVSSYLGADGSKLYNDKIPVSVVFTTHSNVAANKFINSKLPNDAEIISDSSTIDLLDTDKKTKRSINLSSTGYFLINDCHIRRLNLISDDSSINLNKNKIYTNYFNTVNF